MPDFIKKLKFKNMITVSTEKEKVVINVRVDISGVLYNFDLKYTRYCSMDARLLANQINKDLNKKIETIRRTAYELGWKDAKSKKVSKRNWFNGNINSHYV